MSSDTCLLYFLSVHPFVQTDGQKDKIVKCRSNSPIFKIIFLLARYDIRYLSFVHFVCPSVCPYPPPPSKTCSNHPIFKIPFFCWQGLTSVTYILYFCLSIRSYRRTDRKTKSSNVVLTVRFSNLFFCFQGMTSDTFI